MVVMLNIDPTLCDLDRGLSEVYCNAMAVHDTMGEGGVPPFRLLPGEGVEFIPLTQRKPTVP